MDETRYAELERKRDQTGLTDQEADELGRMMAEQVGKPYGNARERSQSDRPANERDAEGSTENAPPGEMPDREVREAVEDDADEAGAA